MYCRLAYPGGTGCLFRYVRWTIQFEAEKVCTYHHQYQTKALHDSDFKDFDLLDSPSLSLKRTKSSRFLASIESGDEVAAGTLGLGASRRAH